MFNVGDLVQILYNAPYYEGCLGKVTRWKNDEQVEVMILGGESNSLPKMFKANELRLHLSATDIALVDAIDPGLVDSDRASHATALLFTSPIGGSTMYLDGSTIEFYAGWNEAAIAIKRNGIEYAQVILDTVLPDRVYDAHINGQRQAAKVALVCNEVPLATQLLFG